MLTKLISGLIAGACAGAFCLSLSFDLPGIVAVVSAVAFAFFLSASIGPQLRVARLIKRTIGTLLMLAILGLLKNPHQNLVFVLTTALSGALLAFDTLTLWITERQ